MRWISTREMMRKVPPPSGYRMELLKRSDISKLIRFIASWFPDISVGAASCYLRRDFYAEKVYLAGEPERDVLVVLILQGQSSPVCSRASGSAMRGPFMPVWRSSPPSIAAHISGKHASRWRRSSAGK